MRGLAAAAVRTRRAATERPPLAALAALVVHLALLARRSHTRAVAAVRATAEARQAREVSAEEETQELRQAGHLSLELAAVQGLAAAAAAAADELVNGLPAAREHLAS